MSHARITRAALAVSAVFVVAAVVFAAGAGLRSGGAMPAAVEGAASLTGNGAGYFDNRCGRCHGAADLAAWAQAHPDPQARGQWLDDVLQSHFPPPAGEREAIIEYLQRPVAGSGH